MKRQEIETGKIYAVRPIKNASDPVHQAVVIDSQPEEVSGVIVRCITGPNAGERIEVRSSAVLAKWDEKDKFLSDERGKYRIKAFEKKDARKRLVNTILNVVEACGMPVDSWIDQSMKSPMNIHAVNNACNRMGAPVISTSCHPLAFFDRFDNFYAPVEILEQLARSAALSNPDKIALSIENTIEHFAGHYYVSHRFGELVEWERDLIISARACKLTQEWAGLPSEDIFQLTMTKIEADHPELFA